MLEKTRLSVEDGPLLCQTMLVVELMQRVYCVAMALKTSIWTHEDATACYELKMPVMCPIQPLKDACVSITMNIIYSANSHLKSEDSHTSILDKGTKIC